MSEIKTKPWLPKTVWNDPTIEDQCKHCGMVESCCMCLHGATNDSTYVCEYCGIYAAKKPKCNKCEEEY